MSKLGDFDYSEIKKWADNFNEVKNSRVVDRWIRELLYELAFTAEERTKDLTPEDTGHLRENWFVSHIQRKSNSYYVTISNNVEYASYVEYGHRTANHKDWVEGGFMLTISMQEIERAMPAFIERKQQQLFSKLFKGK